MLPITFISSPTYPVSDPWARTFSSILTATTPQPLSGPRKNPANSAGSSEISNFKNPGANGSDRFSSINTAETAPIIPINTVFFTDACFILSYPFRDSVMPDGCDRPSGIVLSSFIRTIPSVTESHRIMPFGLRTLPPVGNCTPPRRSQYSVLFL